MISHLTPAMQACEHFSDYMAEDNYHDLKEGLCLADYIYDWIHDRGCAIGCFGDFSILLKAIPLIVDRWYRDPTMLHSHIVQGGEQVTLRRTAVSAFGDLGAKHPIFNEDSFTRAFFRWQYLDPRRPAPLD